MLAEEIKEQLENMSRESKKWIPVSHVIFFWKILITIDRITSCSPASRRFHVQSSHSNFKYSYLGEVILPRR